MILPDIRETSDRIESLGIERTFQKLEQASIVLWVIDSTTAQTQYASLAQKILPHCKGKKLIRLFNKSDLLSPEAQTALSYLPLDEGDTLFISAKQHENTDALQSLLVKDASLPEISQSDVIVTNIRHFEALSHALDAIRRVQDGLSARLSGDFLSQDIRECIFYLNDILGEVTNDEVLGNIFRKFCIGK